MLKYLASRFLTFIPTFIGVTMISFGFIRMLPGDPIIVMAGERGLSAERYAELSEKFGFDRPVYVQFWEYLTGVMQGDLGNSFVTKLPVWDEFFALFPATLELSLCAMIFAVMLGLPAGVIAAVNRGKFFDRALMTTALIGYSMPIFWWALLLIIVFSGNLQWTPVSGRIDLIYYFPAETGFMLIDSLLSGQAGAFKSAVRHLILPTFVLGTIPLAVIARQTRSCHVGSSERRLYPYRPRQRAYAVPHQRYSCIAQRPDPGDHSDWPVGRHAVGRGHSDRNNFQLAWNW